VQFLPNSDNYILSAGQDKELKLWYVDPSSPESTCVLKSSIKLNEQIEHLCFMGEEGLLAVANGNLISLVSYTEDSLKVN